MTESEFKFLEQRGYQKGTDLLWADAFSRQPFLFRWLVAKVPFGVTFVTWLMTWVFLRVHKIVKLNNEFVLITPTSFKRALWVAIRSCLHVS